MARHALFVLTTTLAVVLSGCQVSSPVAPSGDRSLESADGPCDPEVKPC
jgi:hypothetical protein